MKSLEGLEDDEEDKVDIDDMELEKKLNEYFGGDVESNENSKFRRSYFMNQMWIDKSGKDLDVGMTNCKRFLRMRWSSKDRKIMSTDFRKIQEIWCWVMLEKWRDR